jgi:DNA polymerase IV
MKDRGSRFQLSFVHKEQLYPRPTPRHLADRICSRLRANSRPGRTVTVRVRFADLRSVTRSITLDAPILTAAILAEIAEELVRFRDHPRAVKARGPNRFLIH